MVRTLKFILLATSKSTVIVIWCILHACIRYNLFLLSNWDFLPFGPHLSFLSPGSEPTFYLCFCKHDYFKYVIVVFQEYSVSAVGSLGSSCSIWLFPSLQLVVSPNNSNNNSQNFRSFVVENGIYKPKMWLEELIAVGGTTSLWWRHRHHHPRFSVCNLVIKISL